MHYRRFPLTLKITLLYTVPAACWILLSDQILSAMVTDLQTFLWVQTWKGWWFVAVSAIGLYVILQKSLRTQEQIHTELTRQKTILECQSEASPDGIVVVGSDGRILSYNRRFADIWQIPDEVMQTRDPQAALQAVYHALHNPQEFAARVQALYQQPDAIDHSTIVLIDGRTLERHSLPMRSSNGVYLGRVWYYRDISTTRQAEAELQTSRVRLQAMFDNAAAAIVLANTSGQITEVNDRWVEMFGYTAEEALQLRPQDITYAEDQALSARIFAQLITGQMSRYRYEKRMVRKDGSVFWADVGVTTICTEHNQVTAVQAILIDIDERKQAEAALREHEEQLRQANAILEQRVVERTAELSQANQELQAEIAERKRTEASLRESQRFIQQIAHTIPDLLYVHDILAQQNIFVNRQIGEMLGYSEAAIQAMGTALIPTLLHPDDLKLGTTWQLARIAVAQDGDILELSYRVKHANGTWRWLYVRETVFTRTANHAPQQILGVAQDITERKRTEETLQRYTDELRKNAEETRQFAYIVSHDLRAPLLNLKGFAGELQAAMEAIQPLCAILLPQLPATQQRYLQELLTEDVPESLQFIHTSVDQMDHLINALLKLSRLGRRELYLGPVDMQSLVARTVQTLAYRIEAAQIQIVIGELPTVIADETAMEQIMSNVLNNAVVYLDPDRCGIIEVMAEVGANMTTFMIRDNGRGIAADDMDKVFAPFRRAGTPVVPGEGMGLAYVQLLVRRHGGQIWCRSTPDVGTTFFISIPNQPAKETSDV